MADTNQNNQGATAGTPLVRFVGQPTPLVERTISRPNQAIFMPRAPLLHSVDSNFQMVTRLARRHFLLHVTESKIQPVTKKVAAYVQEEPVLQWQAQGFASDMAIETGKENERANPRTIGVEATGINMFNPRQLLQISC